MLLELSIDNFAIIDHLHVRFSSGLTVLTGETGAGKSIIIDALQIALGMRAAGDLVRGDARLAAVEALFEWPEGDESDPLNAILSDAGIEEDSCLILRREISPSGRSTARVNGHAVPLSVLSAIGDLLVDIHGQSEHLSILRRDRQLDVLDAYGRLKPLRLQVTEAVKEYAGLQRSLEELSSSQRDAEQRLDLLRFQVDEIQSASLRPEEEEELQTERNLLVNAERLTQLSGAVCESLQGEAGAALDAIHRGMTSLRELVAIDPALSSLHDRLETAQYEVQDIAQEMRQYRDRVEYDPQRLDGIEDRLDHLNRLKRKYGASLPEVIAFGERARAEMEAVENLDERLASLTVQVGQAESRAAALAEDLSLARRQAAVALAQAMRDALGGLGLRSADFQVEVTQTPSPDGLPLSASGERYAYSQSGIDRVSFVVSFNPGEPLRPLDKVASGGETSRFLLALKSVLAEADGTPTLIFDEVDVGVGARAGMAVGERMRRLSQEHQVISITHLPQIAALADHHLSVTKSTANGHTGVTVRTLDSPQRVLEIAEMMSGSGTEAARRNARELLEAAQRM